MATMSGSAARQSRTGPASPPRRATSCSPTARRLRSARASGAASPGRSRSPGISSAIAAAGPRPDLWPEAAPEHPDYIRALIYNPPPPPPPPLPKGSGARREDGAGEAGDPRARAREARRSPPRSRCRRKSRSSRRRATPETEQAGSERAATRRRRGHGGRAGGRRGGRRARRRARRRGRRHGRRAGARLRPAAAADQDRRGRSTRRKPSSRRSRATVELRDPHRRQRARGATRAVVKSIPLLDAAAIQTRLAVGLRARDQERPAGGHHRHRPRHLPDFLGRAGPREPRSRCRMPVGDERGAAVLTPS